MSWRFRKDRHRKDSNHGDIQSLLKESHCSVIDLSGIGDDCPDLLVGYRGRSFLVEIKSEKGKLSPGQLDFIRLWRGDPVIVARSFDDVWLELSRARSWKQRSF